MSDENKSFSFSYSGKLNGELEQIKKKYSHEETDEKIKKVRALDRDVEFISTMIAIFSGLCGSTLIISGVVWLIKDHLSAFAGILFVASGVFIVSSVPFFYVKIYNSVKSHYAPRILALIKEIEQNQF